MRIDSPFDSTMLLRKKKAITRDLRAQEGLLQKRIAVLGGSTTAEVVDQLEIFLLLNGIRPTFYQSEYNQYYEDALFPGETLRNFHPDLIYVHTTAVNLVALPAMTDSPHDVAALLQNQVAHFQSVWQGIEDNFECPIIQNNVEQPWQRPLGNLDGVDYRGRSRFVARLNEALIQASEQYSNVYLHDIHYLSARIGMDHWFSPRLYYLYKYAINVDVIPQFAHQLAAVMLALWGMSKKCLVLDLDNTLWGGVIGDDGVQGIRIGTGDAVAEAHTDVQRYVLALKARGVILTVCSKNNNDTAREGLAHPDGLLRPEDFSILKANWNPKSDNLSAIADEINIGVDSLVFVDDNPAEREIVRAQLPAVSVPEVGSDITDLIRTLDQAALFEAVSLSPEDVSRAANYADNVRRVSQQAQFASYEDFLKSLKMHASIAPFSAAASERIAQLTNKTNQFNLTTRRYSAAEIGAMVSSTSHIALCGRLSDKFGDNGLISVLAGEIKGDELHIDLWLMSCRVLKRGMEDAMFEQLCQRASVRGVRYIVGYYLPTAKNKMVAGIYHDFGFVQTRASDTETVWRFDLSTGIPNIKHCIEVTHEQG